MADARTCKVGSHGSYLILGPEMMGDNGLRKVRNFYVFMKFKTTKWQQCEIYLSFGLMTITDA